MLFRGLIISIISLSYSVKYEYTFNYYCLADNHYQVMKIGTNECSCKIHCFLWVNCTAVSIKKENGTIFCGFSTETEEQNLVIKDDIACITHTKKFFAKPRPELTMDNFFVTPRLKYDDGKEFCAENGGSMFVPISEDEHLYLQQHVVQMNNRPTVGWFPLNDKEVEGTMVFENGVAYENRPYDPAFRLRDLNSDVNDCAGVDENNLLSFGDCNSYSLPMLCLRDDYYKT